MLIIVILASSCSNYKEGRLSISPQKTDQSVHLGRGVWMEVPNGYNKARSFDGYQTPKAHSSISITMSTRSLEQIKAGFAPSALRKKNSVLLELSQVSYEGSENGIFSVVHDKMSNTIRYAMAISYNNRVYYIKAFCFDQFEERFDPLIRKSFMSIFIGSLEESVEVFRLAKFEGLNRLIQTKDGEYPTQSPDAAVIEWTTMDDLTGISEIGLVGNELQKLTGVESPGVYMIYLENGKYYRGTASTENKKAYVGLLVTEGRKGTLMVCHGNANSSLEEFEKHTYGKLVKTKIVGAR